MKIGQPKTDKQTDRGDSVLRGVSKRNTKIVQKSKKNRSGVRKGVSPGWRAREKEGKWIGG